MLPGYQLSHACKDALARDPWVQGLWLAQHGLFTFAETARECYELMIAFVTLAEEYLARADLPELARRGTVTPTT